MFYQKIKVNNILPNFSLPIHPQLVHFPIAFLLLGGCLLLIHLYNSKENVRKLGISCIVIGWIFMIPTIVAGLWEASKLKDGSRMDQVADQHTTAAFVTWVLFSAILFILFKYRNQKTETKLRVILSVLLFMALIALNWTSNLGGKLVYEMGVGVQEIVR